MTTRPRAIESRVGELADDEERVAEQLPAAVPDAVGQCWASTAVAMSRPAIATVLPALWGALGHRRSGGRETSAAVEGLSVDSEKEGTPLFVPLTALRATVARQSSLVVARASEHRGVAVAPLLSEMAVVSHDSSLAVVLPRERRPPPLPAWASALLPVQRDVLELTAEGWSTVAIADELHHSPQNVSHHLSRMIHGAGVTNRTALVARAVRCGALSPSGG